MQFCKSIIHFGVIGASIVATSLPARALVITYTDRDAFLAALSSSSTDTYNDLSPVRFVTSPLNRTITGYTYNATAAVGLALNTVNGSTALSNAVPGALALNFTAGAPTAVGGYFFNTDPSYNVVNSVITVTANPGASAQSVSTGSATNFFGWLDDSGTPFTSLVIAPSGGSLFPTVDNLVLGQAAPAAEVPGPLPVLGLVAAFSFSRRLRSRIAAARHR